MTNWTPINRSATPSWTPVGKVAYEDFLLMEDGGFLLLEDGGKIILEQSQTRYMPTWTAQGKS